MSKSRKMLKEPRFRNLPALPPPPQILSPLLTYFHLLSFDGFVLLSIYILIFYNMNDKVHRKYSRNTTK